MKRKFLTLCIATLACTTSIYAASSKTKEFLSSLDTNEHTSKIAESPEDLMIETLQVIADDFDYFKNNPEERKKITQALGKAARSFINTKGPLKKAMESKTPNLERLSYETIKKLMNAPAESFTYEVWTESILPMAHDRLKAHITQKSNDAFEELKKKKP